MSDYETGTWVGRVWREGVGPSLVTVRSGALVDITDRAAPTMRDVLEMDDPAGYVRAAAGETLGPVEGAALLAPCDLQAVKAAGVTFARSMVERVIEERAAGDPTAAEAIRARIGGAIGDSLRDIEPGSERAEAVKAALIAEGLWSQYLEVGIGPYAEIFTKTQPMASVGHLAEIGLHPASVWNNPEPEIVLAVSSRGVVLGACLGNDVNLRDFEGRSALLLSKAKDNTGSSAIGPMFRLYDESFGPADVARAVLTLEVTGRDGFVLRGTSEMAEISRSPDALVEAAFSVRQFPDGLVLYLGTLFAPTEDRDVPGEGFTHKPGDRVEISAPGLGRLSNTVTTADRCPPWTFGTADLMRNLAGRGLL